MGTDRIYFDPDMIIVMVIILVCFIFINYNILSYYTYSSKQLCNFAERLFLCLIEPYNTVLILFVYMFLRGGELVQSP